MECFRVGYDSETLTLAHELLILSWQLYIILFALKKTPNTKGTPGATARV